MKLSKFGNSVLIDNQIQSYSKIEECKRLANELRSKPERIIPANNYYRLKEVVIPAYKGFDIETCEFKDIKKYISNTPKISQSLLMLMLRIMALRFPKDYQTIKKKSSIKTELNLIESDAKNDISWFGEVGFQNCVRLDNSLTSKNIKVLKKKNDILEIVRK
jgi:hypothetical protein